MKNKTKPKNGTIKEIIRQNNIILDNYRKGFKLIEEALKVGAKTKNK